MARSDPAAVYVVPSLWEENFDSLIDAGRLFAPYDVLVDLEMNDYDAFLWAKERECSWRSVLSSQN